MHVLSRTMEIGPTFCHMEPSIQARQQPGSRAAKSLSLYLQTSRPPDLQTSYFVSPTFIRAEVTRVDRTFLYSVPTEDSCEASYE